MLQIGAGWTWHIFVKKTKNWVHSKDEIASAIMVNIIDDN